MSGIGAVFGEAPGSTTAAANANTIPPATPPGYSSGRSCFLYNASSGLDTQFSDGSTLVRLQVPPKVLPDGTIICIYKGDLAALGSEVPSGHTPASAYAVLWNSPPSNLQPDAAASLTLTVTDPAVSDGDPIFMFDKTTGNLVSAGTSVDHTWVVTFKRDPGFVVTTPPAATTPPTATGPTTAPTAVVTEPTTTG